MTSSIKFDSETIHIVRSPKRIRSTSLSILPDHSIQIRTSPWTSVQTITDFVKSKWSWIIKVRSRLPKTSADRLYQPGTNLYYLGKAYLVTWHQNSSLASPKLAFSPDTGFVYQVPSHHSPETNLKAIRDLTIRWYKHQLESILFVRIAYYANLIGASYKRVTIKDVSSIWGSCSRQGNLNFNRRLILTPPDALDYVIAHEVSHLIHHHHRPTFWAQVARLCPDYKTHIKWFKTNQFLLQM